MELRRCAHAAFFSALNSVQCNPTLPSKEEEVEMDGKKPINKYNNVGTRTSKSVGCHKPTSKPIVGTVSIYATFCAPLELGHRRGASVLANVATSINDPNLGKRWVTCNERTFGVPLQHVIMIIIDFVVVLCGVVEAIKIVVVQQV